MDMLFGITDECHISYDISNFLMEPSSSMYNNLAGMKRKWTGQLSLFLEPVPKVVEHLPSGASFRSTSAIASLSSSKLCNESKWNNIILLTRDLYTLCTSAELYCLCWCSVQEGNKRQYFKWQYNIDNREKGDSYRKGRAHFPVKLWF